MGAAGVADMTPSCCCGRQIDWCGQPGWEIEFLNEDIVAAETGVTVESAATAVVAAGLAAVEDESRSPIEVRLYPLTGDRWPLEVWELSDWTTISSTSTRRGADAVDCSTVIDGLTVTPTTPFTNDPCSVPPPPLPIRRCGLSGGTRLVNVTTVDFRPANRPFVAFPDDDDDEDDGDRSGLDMKTRRAIHSQTIIWTWGRKK
jgi:hypothetical protein